MTLSVLASDPLYLKAAFSVLGLSEIEGSRHEARVLAMYVASGNPQIHDDETPWCAAYVGWSLAQGGKPNTKSLLAISYASYGTALDRTKLIPRGAIAVWTRVGGNHVNFVLEDDGTYVTCLGGNQENNHGGGVTISRRLKSQAVAYRMPPDTNAAQVPIVPKPTTKKAVARKVVAAGGAVVAGTVGYQAAAKGYDPAMIFFMVAGIVAVAAFIYFQIRKSNS